MPRPLVLEDFSHRIGESFAISEQGLEAFPLKLAEAVPLRATWSKPGARPPFSLIFLGANSCILPQRLYKFDLADVGLVDIFLVPIGKSEKGVSYQAVFN
jgi:hypothetical protein